MQATYRPDIDGLRTVAVLPVVFFHAGVPGFFGGFVGVDVFFVISGYLITGIVWRELEAGSFSIPAFYRRRVLRIFPALFAMLAVVAAVAYATFLPSQLLSFARSVVSTALFYSNVEFYLQAGYFGPAGHDLPLLHTWSLAVEEQFYIVWPMTLWVAYRRGGKQMAAAITAAALFLSLAASIWWLPRDAEGTFYLPHTRAWELLVGALLALQPLPMLQHRAAREIASVLGLAAIAFAVMTYNQTVPFPGATALVPVLGAAALIAAGEQGPTWAGRLLSVRPMVFVGLLSFPLYLWHWPVFVLARTAGLIEATPTAMTALTGVSMLIAWMSWRWVETPLRRGVRSLPTWRVLGAAAGAIATFSAAGAWAAQAGGLPSRYSPEQRSMAAFLAYEGDVQYRGGSCFVVDVRRDRFDAATCLAPRVGEPTLLLAGDSHAAHLWPGFAALKGSAQVLQATHTGCRPVLGEQAGPCFEYVRWLFEQWLPQHPVDAVVLAGRWSASDVPALARTITALRAHALRVVVVGPVPQYVAALPGLIARYSDDPTRVQQARDRRGARVEEALRAQATAAGARYVSLTDALCPQQTCRVLAQPGVPMQFDYGHFTREGSEVAVAYVWSAALADLPAMSTPPVTARPYIN